MIQLYQLIVYADTHPNKKLRGQMPLALHVTTARSAAEIAIKNSLFVAKRRTIYKICEAAPTGGSMQHKGSSPTCARTQKCEFTSHRQKSLATLQVEDQSGP